jgi:photosystem II stability/assembly factor-like uncharacterized protein
MSIVALWFRERASWRKEQTMTKLYIGLDGALAVVAQRADQWTADVRSLGTAQHRATADARLSDNPHCVAADPLRPELVYCGAFGGGLWRSSDAGATWNAAGEALAERAVQSVAVSATERVNGQGVVYAGTEPSALFRSEDGGATWQELAALRQLPSAPTWSFPPRPYTSHVRWITSDPLVAGRVYVAIEAGALVRSLDGGQTWEDRKPDGPYDTHTLAMHRLAPDRLYSAAGDGFMQPGNGFVESRDGGATWQRPDVGLRHHYLWSVAVDPTDPDTLVISAAHGPREAHDPGSAESAIYRRAGGGEWRPVRDGLPEPRGLLAPVLVANQAEPGVFYAASNRGIFRSADAGETWEELRITWPEGFRLGRASALVAVAA